MQNDREILHCLCALSIIVPKVKSQVVKMKKMIEELEELEEHSKSWAM
jgi:hypothetical protein